MASASLSLPKPFLLNQTSLPSLPSQQRLSGLRRNSLRINAVAKKWETQLGGGVEEKRLYPSPVANLRVSPTSFSLSPSPGQLINKTHLDEKLIEVGISCGLFHSALLVNGNVWIWGKGDGGRLGFGHETSVFVPTLNPHLVLYQGYGGFSALGHRVYHRELLPRLVEGEVYTWGRDEGDGRLGLGPGPGPNEGGGMSVPSKVKTLPVPAAAVCCGGFFTTVLTKEGKVWNWGVYASILWVNSTRLNEVRRLLGSASPVVIQTSVNPSASDQDIQQAQLWYLVQRTTALPLGRGAFTLGTISTLLTEAFTLPKLVLAGRLPAQQNATVCSY